MLMGNELVYRLLACATAVAAFHFGPAGGAHAQSLTVTRVTVDGRPAESVAEVDVRTPGLGSSQPREIRAGQVIASVTELRTPRGASIELTSGNGNAIVVHPGARFLAGIVTGKGESHQPLGGRIDFRVRKALDFFNIQYDRITASVKGTEYSVDIDPGKSMRFAVSESVIEVERQVQIRFTASTQESTSGQGHAIRAAEDIYAGQSKTYRLDIDEYLAEFNDFGEAEAYFMNELKEAEASRDNRRILRAVQNLMGLYWMIAKPRAALELQGRCVELVRRESAGSFPIAT
jgi:hypothetical protein